MLRRHLPFAGPHQHFSDLGHQGHGRIANPLRQIEGESPFAGIRVTGWSPDAAVNGRFDNHAPHQQAEFLNAFSVQAADGQVHQHGSDHVLGRGCRDEKPSARTATYVQQTASLQNDHGFATCRPTQTQALLHIRKGTEGLADGPASLQIMHFHGGYGFVGQVARGIVGANNTGGQPPRGIGDLTR